jgi:nuclear GTP-binding protein
MLTIVQNRKKMVCKTAPIPGETKIWQYITLTRRIYLIDCPGVVPPNPNDSPEQILLRGVVRVENVENPAQYVEAALRMCQRKYIVKTYELYDWQTSDQFLELLARKTGKLLKGGEADLDAVAKMMLNDFLRGRIPWFVAPPQREGEEENIEGREGRLGEMSKKRKRDVEAEEKQAAVNEATTTTEQDDEEDDEDTEDDFAGFEEDEGGVVVNPAAIGNLDGLAADESDNDDENDDDEDDGSEEGENEAELDDEVTSSEEERAAQLGGSPPKKRRKSGIGAGP